MVKTLLLILVVFSSLCVAQIETARPKPVAEKIDEFGRSTDGEVKARMDNFYIQLANDPSAQGYIINYGLPKDINVRRKQITKLINFRRYDPQRLTFVDGGFSPIFKTEFWSVPNGAEPPMPQTEAKQVDEFEKATSGDIKARIDNLYIELNNNQDFQGYILNFGTKQQIALRNQYIKKAVALRKFDLSLITFIEAGTSKTIKTEFWIDKKTP